MQGDFSIVMDKDKIDIDMFRGSDHLPRIVMNLNICTPFVCFEDDKIVAQCLVKKDNAYEGLYDIVNHAEDNPEHFRQMMTYVIGYYKENGGRYIDLGCGNAQVKHYSMLQRLGFRVIGVIPDHYIEDNKTATVENGIFNRDMIRFRADLLEKAPS